MQDSRERSQKHSEEDGENRDRLRQHQYRLPNKNGVQSILTHPHPKKHPKTLTKTARKRRGARAGAQREACRRV